MITVSNDYCELTVIIIVCIIIIVLKTVKWTLNVEVNSLCVACCCASGWTSSKIRSLCSTFTSRTSSTRACQS